MYFQLVFMYSILNEINAFMKNDFIVNYFVHKGISKVVGYSCNLAEGEFFSVQIFFFTKYKLFMVNFSSHFPEELLLVKKFSESGVAVALYKLSFESNIQKQANTSFSRLGIFLDVRCYATRDIIAMFDQVLCITCDSLLIASSIDDV